MAEQTFELKLIELAKCVKDLSEHTWHLQNLFCTCLEDYKKLKQKTILSDNSPHSNENSPSQPQNMIITQNLNTHKHRHKKKNEFHDQSFELKFDNAENDIKNELLDGSQYSAMKRNSPEKTQEIKIIIDQIINEKDLLSDDEITPESFKIQQTNRKRKKRKRRTNSKIPRPPRKLIFSALSDSEKNLILYDKMISGQKSNERKYGIHGSRLLEYNKTKQLFKNIEEKEKWIENQKYEISKIMEELVQNKTQIVTNIENNLLNEYDKNIKMEEIAEFSFDRGLAVAAARYNINLYELEYILKEEYSTKWIEMETQKWFCVFRNSDDYLSPQIKSQMLKLVKEEGAFYAAKKFGVSIDKLREYGEELIFTGFDIAGGLQDTAIIGQGESNL